MAALWGENKGTLLAGIVLMCSAARVVAGETSPEPGQRSKDIDALRRAATRRVLDRKQTPEDRAAALAFLLEVAAEPEDRLAAGKLCRGLLASRATPEVLLLSSAEDLARVLKADMALRDAATEVERLAAKLPPKTQNAVAAAMSILRKSYHSRLQSRIAGSLQAPVDLQVTNLGGDAMRRFVTR